MKNFLRPLFRSAFLTLLILILHSCDENDSELFENDTAVFLLIDEDSIDNGNEPNNFSDVNVNDQLAVVGLRTPLRYFQNNVGKEITVYTGDVGDEGWHALKTIPSSWISAGPTNNGLSNYLVPGPGLGGGEDDREILLDEISNVTPLRATGLAMLKGQTVFAVVYDSEISTNYSPLQGNLMGSNLGIVSFDVIEVTKRTDGSTSSLPRVTIRIRNVADISQLPLGLFSNAPVPQSSSEPFDITPPNSVSAITIVKAD